LGKIFFILDVIILLYGIFTVHLVSLQNGNTIKHNKRRKESWIISNDFCEQMWDPIVMWHQLEFTTRICDTNKRLKKCDGRKKL